MTTIDANDLATHSDEMLRQIGQTGQPIDIIENGVIVARVIPIYGHSTSKDLATFWSDWDMMSQDIGEELERQGIKTVDADELMKDVRG
jgi:antitoxin (DNA-binding transcriptional repressor) of toxin-antitoxin stability system